MNRINDLYDKVGLCADKKTELKAALKAKYPQYANDNVGSQEEIVLNKSDDIQTTPITASHGAQVRSRAAAGIAAAIMLTIGCGTYFMKHNSLKRDNDSSYVNSSEDGDDSTDILLTDDSSQGDYSVVTVDINDSASSRIYVIDDSPQTDESVPVKTPLESALEIYGSSSKGESSSSKAAVNDSKPSDSSSKADSDVIVETDPSYDKSFTATFCKKLDSRLFTAEWDEKTTDGKTYDGSSEPVERLPKGPDASIEYTEACHSNKRAIEVNGERLHTTEYYGSDKYETYYDDVPVEEYDGTKYYYVFDYINGEHPYVDEAPYTHHYLETEPSPFIRDNDTNNEQIYRMFFHMSLSPRELRLTKAETSSDEVKEYFSYSASEHPVLKGILFTNDMGDQLEYVLTYNKSTGMLKTVTVNANGKEAAVYTLTNFSESAGSVKAPDYNEFIELCIKENEKMRTHRFVTFDVELPADLTGEYTFELYKGDRLVDSKDYNSASSELWYNISTFSEELEHGESCTCTVKATNRQTGDSVEYCKYQVKSDSDTAKLTGDYNKQGLLDIASNSATQTQTSGLTYSGSFTEAYSGKLNSRYFHAYFIREVNGRTASYHYITADGDNVCTEYSEAGKLDPDETNNIKEYYNDDGIYTYRNGTFERRNGSSNPLSKANDSDNSLLRQKFFNTPADPKNMTFTKREKIKDESVTEYFTYNGQEYKFCYRENSGELVRIVNTTSNEEYTLISFSDHPEEVNCTAPEKRK